MLDIFYYPNNPNKTKGELPKCFDVFNMKTPTTGFPFVYSIRSPFNNEVFIQTNDIQIVSRRLWATRFFNLGLHTSSYFNGLFHIYTNKHDKVMR